MTAITVAQWCAQCGDPIGPPRKLYCSAKCANKAYLERVKDAARTNNVNAGLANNVNLCQRCLKPVPRASRRPRLYCSDTCRVLASKARAATRRPAPDTWIPAQRDNTTAAALRRRELIRELAAEGHSSQQISDRIGTVPQTIRQIARDLRIEIPADQVLHKTHRHSSSRIIRETVQALEGLAMGTRLITDLVGTSDVDPAEAAAWATSLTDSIQALSRFTNQIKEMAQ